MDVGLRLVAAAGLLVSAYVHLHLAPGYSLVGRQVTQGALFRAQAVVAVLAAMALLARGHRLAWLPAVLVAAGSLLALVGTVYVAVPAVGPFPRVYEPVWFGEKMVAAVSVTVGLLAAGAGLMFPSTETRRSM
jgi:hypothetical protein